ARPRVSWPAMAGVGRRRGASMLGVLVLSVMIVATPAGRRPFWSSDEARFALLAQDALDHGRWLVAELRGQHYLNKPQLFFWAVAAAAVPFGRDRGRLAPGARIAPHPTTR